MNKLCKLLLSMLCNQAFAVNDDSLAGHGFAVNDDTPAFALLIKKDRKTIFKDVQGCARFDSSKNCILKANLDTAFAIGSMTKHFTAAAILMLEEEGKLSTEDEVIKHLDLPDKFKGIKIKHLIFHTSGIPDYLSTDIIYQEDKKFTADDAVEKIKNLDLKAFGVNWSYSNSAYVLLGKIIEKLSAQTYEQFLHEKVFDKFEMKNTFITTQIETQNNYTFQYSPWPIFKEEKWPQILKLKADGGIWISINDYEKWLQAFDNNKIFKKKETMQKFLSRGKLDDGADIMVDRGSISDT